jgi:hypothetical protein
MSAAVAAIGEDAPDYLGQWRTYRDGKREAGREQRLQAMEKARLSQPQLGARMISPNTAGPFMEGDVVDYTAPFRNQRFQGLDFGQVDFSEYLLGRKPMTDLELITQRKKK